MIFVALPIFLFLLLYGIKYKKGKNFFEDNMSYDKTTSINGFFVIVIFISHFRIYIENKNIYDTALYDFPVLFTQLIVVSFFFYSGYGLMESYKKKGFSYANSIPKKRFPKLFLDLALANILFVILNLILGINYDLQTYLLAFLGWTSIGNSNWFIFMTLCFYIIIYLAFIIFNNKPKTVMVTIIFVLSIGLIIGISYCQDVYFYNTFLCLPMGMYFSLYKDKLLELFKRKYWTYIIISVTVLLSFIFLYTPLKQEPYLFNILSMLFAFLIYLTTLKISIHNKILHWLGKYTFWIYVLQRIPMILFKSIGLAGVNTYLFFFVSLVATLLLSMAMKWVSSKLETMIWLNREKEKNCCEQDVNKI